MSEPHEAFDFLQKHINLRVQYLTHKVTILNIGFQYNSLCSYKNLSLCTPVQLNPNRQTIIAGPLTKDGGERRLNVAITRAKHNVKLVGSILPTDIEVERITREGPKLLRSYIDFAMNGPSVLLREKTESDVIEVSVKQASV